MTISSTTFLMMAWMALLLVGTMGSPSTAPLAPSSSQHHLDAEINKILALPREELNSVDWKNLVLRDDTHHSYDSIRSYVEQKTIEQARQDRVRSQKKKKQLPGWNKNLQQHMQFHRQRLLQEEEAQQQLHDTCATAKLVQPDGPGNSVVLPAESNENLAVIDRPLFCSQFELDYPMLYYKIQGTGNPFYITTCNNHNSSQDEDEQLSPILDVATVGDCNNVATMSCIQEVYGSVFACPTFQDGASVTFPTDNQTEYLFSVRGFFGTAGNFTITVGEIDTVAAQNNSQCETSTEIAVPTSDSPTTVRGSTLGTWSPNSPRDGVCSSNGGPYGNPTSGLWYVMDSPGTAKVTLSTCTSSSSLNNTTISPYIAVVAEEKASDSACINETLQCLETWEQESLACGEVSFVSRPDEQYRIYVAGLYETEYGDIEFEITVEKAEPFGLCRDEWERRESKEGVDCTCEQSPGSDVELTCQDSCLHCSSSTGFCYNRTDTISFGSDLNATFKGYSIDVDYDGIQSITTMMYEELNDGGCTFIINGSSCFSCQTQECGAPLVNCTGDELWDFCEMDNDGVFRAAPVPRQPCGSYVSDTICDRNAHQIAQSESLNCTCATNTENRNHMFTRMTCKTDCGFFCNMDMNNCGKIDLTHTFDLDGTEQSRERWFQPMAEEEDSLTFYQTKYSCLLDNCDCALKTCEDTSVRAIANCTAAEGGGIFDFCNDTMKIGSGPYEFLSGPGFSECIDLSPVNSKCESAIDLVINAPAVVNGSTVFVTEDTMDMCNQFGGSGLYYGVVGTGDRLRISTCSDDTNFSTELSIHFGCDSCVENTREIFCEEELSGASIEWDSEDGQDYVVYVGGFFGDRGTFALQLTNVSAPNYESCESELESPENDNCECLVDEDFPEVSYLDCVEDCTRCNVANDLCGTVTTSDMMENGVVFGEGFTFSFTKGKEASVALFSSGQECFVSIKDEANEFDCQCDIVSCSNENLTYAIDCTNFQDGLSINFCDAIDCSSQSSAENTTESGTLCYSDASIFAPLAPHDIFFCAEVTSDPNPTSPPSLGTNTSAIFNGTSPSLSPAVKENATNTPASVAQTQLSSPPDAASVTSAPSGEPREFKIPQGRSSAGNTHLLFSYFFTLVAFLVGSVC